MTAINSSVKNGTLPVDTMIGGVMFYNPDPSSRNVLGMYEGTQLVLPKKGNWPANKEQAMCSVVVVAIPVQRGLSIPTVHVAEIS